LIDLVSPRIVFCESVFKIMSMTSVEFIAGRAMEDINFEHKKAPNFFEAF